MAAFLRIHHAGDWPAERVVGMWTPSTLVLPPGVPDVVDAAWASAVAVPDRSLFDGPMCRLESFGLSNGSVRIGMSRTSYKTFWGTNLSHPELADLHGRCVLANPIGVSPALETDDGWLLMGRRNERVAYYPSRVHPFAGCLEPEDAAGAEAPNLFRAVARELAEELGLSEAEITVVRLTGLAEDVRLRQPELIFRVKTSRSRSEIESQVDVAEHDGVVAIGASETDVAAAVEAGCEQQTLTPVAAASLLLWGRTMFGANWFRTTAARAGADLAENV